MGRSGGNYISGPYIDLYKRPLKIAGDENRHIAHIVRAGGLGALRYSCSDVGESHCGELPRAANVGGLPRRGRGPACQHAGLPRRGRPPRPSPRAPRQAEKQANRSSRGQNTNLSRGPEHDQNNPFFRSVSSARLASHLHFGDAESFETGKVAIVSLPLALSHTLWSHFQAQSRSGS